MRPAREELDSSDTELTPSRPTMLPRRWRRSGDGEGELWTVVSLCGSVVSVCGGVVSMCRGVMSV